MPWNVVTLTRFITYAKALLDIFTIEDEFSDSGGLAGKTVVLLGDLKHGRTVHSLAKLIARSGLAGVSLRYCSPDVLRMPEDVKDEVDKYGIPQEVRYRIPE